MQQVKIVVVLSYQIILHFLIIICPGEWSKNRECRKMQPETPAIWVSIIQFTKKER